MFDQLNLQNPRRAHVRTWVGKLGTNAAGWDAFVIPRNASMLYLLCLGGGSSGGGGQSTSGGTAGGGGGGGASGAMARLLIPAMFLPKTLYLSPGVGGLGVAAATVGNAGVRSFIAAKPFSGATVQQDLVLVSGAAAATGGAVGALSAAGGVAETIATNVLQQYSGLGIWTAIAGQAGTASGATGAAGVASTWGANGVPVGGGTGGGSTSTTTTQFAGGAITGSGLVPSIAGGVAPAGNGNPGFNAGSFLSGWNADQAGLVAQIFAFTGGTGGGAQSSGTAGQGGQGSLGSGGGGGGGSGGTTGGTGGRSGAGGPGLIVIAWW
jgi:hypothetical protein